MPNVSTPNHPSYVDVPDAASVRNLSFRLLPVRLLRWIERRYLDFEFRGVKRAAKADEDAWWFAFENNAVGPCRIDDILNSLLDGCSPAAIVHASKTSEVPAPWQTISYRAWWSDSATARVWTIGFWLGSFVLGWFLVCLAMPLRAQGLAQLAYLFAVIGIVVTRRRIGMSWRRIWRTGSAKSEGHRPATRDDSANCWMTDAPQTIALRPRSQIKALS